MAKNKNSVMKNNISSSLGLKQQELAQLLQVSRSQLSLYELGKRNLPLPAMEKLATMLTYLKKEALKSETNKSISVDDQNYLKKLLLKNNHQQLLVERKITVLEKKQKAFTISSELISYLLKDKSKMNKSEFAILKTIERKNQESLNYATNLLQLELKKEVLRFEEKLLRKKL